MSKLTLQRLEIMDLREVLLTIEATEALIAQYEAALVDHRHNLTHLNYRRNKLERLEKESRNGHS